MKVKGERYAKKRDQRELIKVAQRNFRKYMALRDWGWFVIIQKTRPLVGRPDPNEELRLLEEKANATYGVYKEKVGLSSSRRPDLLLEDLIQMKNLDFLKRRPIINILKTRWSNVSGGRQHDSIKELNMGLQLI